METHVKLYDPAVQGFSRLELIGNFNPQIHTRWEYRPSAVTVAFSDILDVPGITPAVDAALHDANIHTAEDLVGAGLVGLAKVTGVKAQDARRLLAWASRLIPPVLAVDDEEPDADPALAALVQHAAHERRAAGLEEPAAPAEEPPPAADPGASTGATSADLSTAPPALSGQPDNTNPPSAAP